MSVVITDSDDGMSICSGCDVVFDLVWNRNAWTDGMSYCPFCGDEVTDETDEPEDRDA